jgi:hypothetical protein
MLLQRPGKAGAGIDFGPQRGDQLMLAFVLGFLGQRGQCALYGQAGADQPRELAGPDRQTGGVEDRAREPSGSACAAPALPAATGSTCSGTRAWLRSWLRAARALSASRVPLRVWPWASRASKVKAGMRESI